MGLLSVVFLICSLRTNVAFFIIFLTLAITFGLLTGAYWAMAEDFTGNAQYANKLLVVRTPFDKSCPSRISEEWKLILFSFRVPAPRLL